MSFCLNLSTEIRYEGNERPILNAIVILKRDIAACLTQHGEATEIVLVYDDSCGDEGFVLDVGSGTLQVRHRDALGAVYGLMYLSEHALGYQPLFFWNDAQPATKPCAYISQGRIISPRYAVRYRGWFINDEVLLDPWKETDAERQEIWRMVFETVLRCGGNMVIPGTDRGGDGLDILASDMGLILTQHHAEPLGAEMFGRVWPELKGSYRLYPDKFERLWRDAALRYRGRSVIYAVGYRGQGDGSFWGEDTTFDTEEKRGAEISRVIRRQMEIVRETSPDAKFCTNLYGEMMQLYRLGYLEIPDDVIKVWADNGYGKMVSRRQGSDNPRVDAMPRNETGANGVYYHASFYDLQAANHITPLQIPPDKVARELETVLRNGANAYWIINSGSVKPHVYMLDLIRELWTNGSADVEAHAAAYARAYLGGAEPSLLTDYSSCIPRYGEHEDDVAGDQYYHYAARALCCAAMSGGDAPTRELAWAVNADTVYEQARGIAARCAPSIPKLEAYISRAEREAARLSEQGAMLLRDTLMLAAHIHLSGCRVICELAAGLSALERRDGLRAFICVGKACREAENGYRLLRGAEHGHWRNYYRNDCFTNLNLTANVLRTLRDWTRARFDGPYFWGWEQQCLMKPTDVRIKLQTHRHCQLDNDTLFDRIID